MVFSSAVFLLVFLPVVFILNCLISKKNEYSNILLLIASLIFYAWGEPVLVLVMILSIIVNWLAGKIISKATGKIKVLALVAGIVCDLGLLGFFKYAGFAVSILNSLIGREIIPVPQIVLPIGISFFTFQAISYIADVYKGETDASPKLVNVALYIAFFPQLIAGPIVKYRDINEQINKREVSVDKVADGFRRFCYGLGKKVLLSNVLGLCADTVFAYEMANINSKIAWIGAFTYTLQIYYDFSGYSDMAIGLGKMFGFDILENFNYPYISKSISEFWRRWHISLGTWFREYVYFPLGGSKKGKVRTYVNLTIVFFLTGLWHGAAFTYIAWGMFNGILSMIERLGFKKVLEKSKVLAYTYCFFTVNTGMVIFRSNGLKNAGMYLARMFNPWKYEASSIEIWRFFDNKTLFATICGTIGMGILTLIVPKKIADKWHGSVIEAVYVLGVLVLCLAAIASDTYNPFIYFQF